MALSGSLTTNAYNGVRSLTLNWSATQNISANTSTINWTLIGSGSGTSWYMTGPTKVVIDGAQVHYSTNRIQLRNGTVVASGSHTIWHNTDGTRSFSIGVEGAIYSYSINCTAQQSFTLNQIPREAKLTSAPNFTDEDNPTIQYSNPANLPIYAYIEVVNQSRPIAERKITGSSYTFQFTEAERNVLRSLNTTSNTQPVRFVVRTDMGGYPLYAWIDRTLTIKNPNPTLNPKVVDTNSQTTALTGNSSSFVKYYSNAKVTFGAQAVKGASLVASLVVCGGKSRTSDGTIKGVESGDFVFAVGDSRGNKTTKGVSRTLVNYVKLSCNIGNSTPDASGGYDMEITGNYFYGSFGAVNNTLAVEYRYRKQGEDTWGAWTAVDSVQPIGFTYLARAKVEGLDYQTTYEFQARATDKLATVTTSAKAVKSLPTFDWSETDFNFNVPVIAQGHHLVGAAKALGTTYKLPISITPKTGYSNMAGIAKLMGSNLVVDIDATRTTPSGVGNISNEQVCYVEIRHGGKIKGIYGQGFPTANTGGMGVFAALGATTNSETCTFTVTLAATAQSLTTFNVIFSLPVSLDLSKY